MTVQAYVSNQLAADYRRVPREDHGKVRFAYFKVVTTADGDIGSTFDLCKLPPGPVRVLPLESYYSVSAQGSARTLSIGHTAYQSKGDGTQEPANASAFVAAKDVSAAVVNAQLATGMKYDLFSYAGVLVQAVIAGGTTPAGTTIEGYIKYVTE